MHNLSKVGIALGSNLGESESLLHQAIEELKKMHEGAVASFYKSSFYKTVPVGCAPNTPSFLNAVVQLETTYPPLLFLQQLQQLELFFGRPSPHPKNEPRTLDLDLLYYGSEMLSLPGLELPHPRAHDREFVLLPLVELSPDLKLPGWKKTAQEYLFKIRK